MGKEEIDPGITRYGATWNAPSSPRGHREHRGRHGRLRFRRPQRAA